MTTCGSEVRRPTNAKRAIGAARDSTAYDFHFATRLCWDECASPIAAPEFGMCLRGLHAGGAAGGAGDYWCAGGAAAAGGVRGAGGCAADAVSEQSQANWDCAASVSCDSSDISGRRD